MGSKSSSILFDDSSHHCHPEPISLLGRAPIASFREQPHLHPANATSLGVFLHRRNLVLGSLIISSSLIFQFCEEPDTTSPTLIISTPVNGSILSSNTTIKLDASDNAGVAYIEIFLDGIQIGEVAGQPYEFNFMVEQWADGENHTITAKAYDEAGNVGLSLPVTITISEVVVNDNTHVLSETPNVTVNNIGPDEIELNNGLVLTHMRGLQSKNDVVG